MIPSSKNISSDKAKLHTEREERSLTPCAHCFQLCCSPNLRLISTGPGLARWSCCKLYFSFRSHSPGHSVCLASNGKSHTLQHGCVCVISTTPEVRKHSQSEPVYELQRNSTASTKQTFVLLCVKALVFPVSVCVCVCVCCGIGSLPVCGNTEECWNLKSGEFNRNSSSSLAVLRLDNTARPAQCDGDLQHLIWIVIMIDCSTFERKCRICGSVPRSSIFFQASLKTFSQTTATQTKVSSRTVHTTITTSNGVCV